MCLYVCVCVGGVDALFLFALRFEFPTGPVCTLPMLQPWMGSTSSHFLQGADLTRLHWQIRPCSFWSTTELHNTNANVQLKGCTNVFTTEIWLNSASRSNLTKSDSHSLSVRALLMAKIGNGNHCGLFQHEVFKCKDVLLGPWGRSGWCFGPLLAVLSVFLIYLLR